VIVADEAGEVAEALAMEKRARARVDRETMFFFTANLLMCGLHRAIIGSNWAWKRNYGINF
jgi:hypothetical protein